MSAVEIDVWRDDEDDDALHLGQAPKTVPTRALDERVGSIVDRIWRNRLILQPEFQRGYVWDQKKASKLVESVLMGIPLPVIYVAEAQNGDWESVDGQQRLTSLASFVGGRFPDGSNFKLGKLQVRNDLSGKSFKDLPREDRAAIEDYSLRVIVICKEADVDLKFEVFQRLNQGSQPLNDMELRNCMYRGPYNDMLRDLAHNSNLKRILGRTDPHPRMVDRQLILRFLAMSRATHLNYRAPMKQFMNAEIERNRLAPPDEIKAMTLKFENAIQSAYDVFGTHAFRRYKAGTAKKPTGSWSIQGNINIALWDTLLYTFGQYERRQIVPAIDAIREEFLDLLTYDDRFNDCISRTTDKPEFIRYRADVWRQRMEKVINVPAGETRAFSRELKKQLHAESEACAICGQHIVDINDAEIDHVEHYWRGGRTISENARLVHRFCNRSRGGRG